MPLRSQTPEVQDRTARLARALGLPVSWIDVVIDRESRWDPKAQSPRSSAVGLCQWVSDTARALGTTREEILAMDAVEQLNLAETMWSKRPRMSRPVDVWLSLLRPASVGADLASTVYASGSTAYEKNRELDADQDGRITVGDLAAELRTHAEKRGIVLVGPSSPLDMQATDWIDEPSQRSAAPLLAFLALGAAGVAAATAGVFDGACVSTENGKEIDLKAWQADPQNRVPLWPNEWQEWVVAIPTEGKTRAEAVLAARTWVESGIFEGAYDLENPFGNLGAATDLTAEWLTDVDTRQGAGFFPPDALAGAVKTWQTLTVLPSFEPSVLSVVRVRFIYRGTLRSAPWPFTGDDYWGDRSGCPNRAQRGVLSVFHRDPALEKPVPAEKDPEIHWNEIGKAVGDALTFKSVPTFIWLLVAVLGLRAVADLKRV